MSRASMKELVLIDHPNAVARKERRGRVGSPSYYLWDIWDGDVRLTVGAHFSAASAWSNAAYRRGR